MYSLLFGIGYLNVSVELFGIAGLKCFLVCEYKKIKTKKENAKYI